MSTVVVATSAADARAVEAVKNHHAQLAGTLALQVEALIDAAARGDLPGAGAETDALVRWCQGELVPHALAEEQAMYPKAHEDPRARMLVDAMLAEHRDLLALVEAIEQATGPVRAAANAEGGCGGECGCGEQDPAGDLPVLDARTVPHAIRHATIFGALDSVAAGSGLVLVSPHDPLPLLAQLKQRSPGLFSVDYLERGPERWRIRFVRFIRA